MRGKRLALAAAGAVVVLAAVAGLASAGALSIGSGGTIDACYQIANGNLRVVEAGSACRGGEHALQWNEQGAAGPPGPAGSAGPAGADGNDGVSVTSTPLPQGDANCPNGGSSFTAANGVTYACNGADGANGTGGGAPSASEATGAGTAYTSDAGAQTVVSLTITSRSLVTGTLTVSMFDSFGTYAVTVRCAIEDAGSHSQLAVQTAGASGAAAGTATLPMTLQAIASPGTYAITCQRVSSVGNWLVSTPRLTAIALS